jgi:hypothetical protein
LSVLGNETLEVRHIQVGEFGFNQGSATRAGAESAGGLRSPAGWPRKVDYVSRSDSRIAVGGVKTYRFGEAPVQQASGCVHNLIYQLNLTSPDRRGFDRRENRAGAFRLNPVASRKVRPRTLDDLNLRRLDDSAHHEAIKRTSHRVGTGFFDLWSITIERSQSPEKRKGVNEVRETRQI